MADVFETQRPAVRGVTHMVATGHYLASAAGYRILENGGNATDAGIAAGMVLGVTLPQWVSLGGVAPILIYSAETNEVKSISGLGRWPKAANLDRLVELGNGQPLPPMLRCITPSAVDAWMTALENFGTMTFEQVSAPAVEICEKGFVVQGTLAHFLPGMAGMIQASQGLQEIMTTQGRLLVEGDLMVQSVLAKTLGRIAEVERGASHKGREQAIRAARDFFYKGDIAREMAKYSQENGGLIGYEDFAEFSVKIESPYMTQYKDYEVYSCGPWCQGPALLEVLNILDGVDVQSMGHNSTAYVHTIAEAVKLAFSDRHYYFGDPDFVPVPMEGLLSKEYARDRRAGLDMETACPEMPEPGDPFKYQSGPRPSFELARKPVPKSAASRPQDTSYVSVVDRWGNAFSATPSDGYQNFVPGLGLSMSARGGQSWLEPDHPSRVEPGKRPRLTPSPSMALKNGKLFMAFGTPGLDVQIQAMTQLFLNIVEFGMDPQLAVEQPRFASFSFPLTGMSGIYEPGMLRCEPGIGAQAMSELNARGHKVEDWGRRNYEAGGLCAIVVDHERGSLTAGADYRRECYAIGR